jgi:hypothetical protein
MATPSKTEKTETKQPAARRSTRLAITIPITLIGKDAIGNSFKENTRTIVVNKHGAKIATVHRLAVGTEVEIENRALGVTARASVVWVGEKRPPQTHHEAGIQLYKAENIWGIEFPPEDWQKGPPQEAGAQKMELGAQPQPASPSPSKAATQAPAGAPTPPATPTPIVAKPPGPPVAKAPPAKASPPRADLHAPKAQVTAEFERMLQRFTRQAEGIAAHQTKVFQDNLESLSREIGKQTQANLQETAARAQENAANAARAQEDGVRALEERLQSLQGDLAAQTTGLEELAQAGQAEAEKARHNIQEASWQALEAATEDLSERIQKELETVSAEFTAQSHKRLEQEASSVTESFATDAEARLKALTEEHLARSLAELQARQTEALEKAKGQAAELVRETLADLETQAPKARERLQEDSSAVLAHFSQDAGERLAKLTEEHVAKIQLVFQALSTQAGDEARIQINDATETESARGLEKMKAQSEALAADSEKSLQSIWQESRERSVREASEDLRRTALELKAALAKEFQDQIAESRNLLKEEIKNSWKSLAEDARRQLMTMATSTAESMNAAAQAGLNEFRNQLQKSLQSVQAQGSQDMEEHLSKLAERHSADLISRLEGVSSEAEEKLLAELRGKAEAAFRESTQNLEQHEAAVLKRQKVAAEASEQASAQFKATIEGVVKEASETVDKHVGSGAMFLKELEEKAKGQLDAHCAKIEASTQSSSGIFAKQIEGMASEVLSKLHQELEALLDRSRKQLEEATAAYQTQIMQEAQAKLAYVTERLTEDSAAQLTTLTQENLEMAQVKLEEAKEKIVSDSEDAFRARLAEVIAPALKPMDRRSKPRAGSEPAQDNG